MKTDQPLVLLDTWDFAVPGVKGEDPTTRFGGLLAGCPLITLVFAPKTRTATCQVPKKRRASPQETRF